MLKREIKDSRIVEVDTSYSSSVVDFGRVDYGIINWIKLILLVVERGVSGWEGVKAILYIHIINYPTINKLLIVKFNI